VKITRKQLLKLLSEGSYHRPGKHQRDREAYDPDGPGDPAMRGVYGDPNEKLRGSTIEYPGGKKAFLQSMIDTYRNVGMHKEADETQAELDAMTDDVFKATLEENISEGFKEEAGAMAFQAALAMLATPDGRRKIADIILFLPNLIERLCDAQFGDGEQGQIGNLKTKLCKLFGYGLTGPFAIAMKITGNMILALDNNAAKVIIDGSNKSMKTDPKSQIPPRGPAMPKNPVPYNAPMQPTPVTDPYLSESYDLNKSEIKRLIRESLANRK
jgi:hypothetical protein